MKKISDARITCNQGFGQLDLNTSKIPAEVAQKEHDKLIEME